MAGDITAEDLAKINSDLDKVTASITEREKAEAIARAKEEAKKEAEAAAELQKKLDEQSKRAKELEDKLTAQQKEFTEKQDAFQKKLDDMAASKQVVANPADANNPFRPTSLGAAIDTWTDDKVNEFEEESARAFLGPDYDRIDA